MALWFHFIDVISFVSKEEHICRWSNFLYIYTYIKFYIYIYIYIYLYIYIYIHFICNFRHVEPNKTPITLNNRLTHTFQVMVKVLLEILKGMKLIV